MPNYASNIMQIVSELLRHKERERQKEIDEWDMILRFQFQREERALDREYKREGDILSRRIGEMDKLDIEQNRVADKFETMYGTSALDATGEGKYLMESITTGDGSTGGYAYDKKNIELNILAVKNKLNAWNKGLKHLKQQGKTLLEAASGQEIGGINWAGIENYMDPDEYAEFKKFALMADDPKTPKVVEGLGWKTTAGADKVWFDKLGGAGRGLQSELLADKRVDDNKARGNRPYKTFKDNIILLSEGGASPDKLVGHLEYVNQKGVTVQPEEGLVQTVIFALQQSTNYDEFMKWVDDYEIQHPKTGTQIREMLTGSRTTNIVFPSMSKLYNELLKEPGYGTEKVNLEVTSGEFLQTIKSSIANTKNKEEAYDLYQQVYHNLTKSDKNTAFMHIQNKYSGASDVDFMKRFKKDDLIIPETSILYHPDTSVRKSATEIYNTLNTVKLSGKAGDSTYEEARNLGWTMSPTEFTGAPGSVRDQYTLGNVMFANVFGGSNDFYKEYYKIKTDALSDRLEFDKKWDFGIPLSELNSKLIEVLGEDRFKILEEKAIEGGKVAMIARIERALKTSGDDYNNIVHALKLAEVSSEDKNISSITNNFVNQLNVKEINTNTIDPLSILNTVRDVPGMKIDDDGFVVGTYDKILTHDGKIDENILTKQINNFNDGEATVDSLSMIYENLDKKYKDVNKVLDSLSKEEEKIDKELLLLGVNFKGGDSLKVEQAIDTLDQDTLVTVAHTLNLDTTSITEITDGFQDPTKIKKDIKHAIIYPGAARHYPETIEEEWFDYFDEESLRLTKGYDLQYKRDGTTVSSNYGSSFTGYMGIPNAYTKLFPEFIEDVKNSEWQPDSIWNMEGGDHPMWSLEHDTYLQGRFVGWLISNYGIEVLPMYDTPEYRGAYDQITSQFPPEKGRAGGMIPSYLGIGVESWRFLVRGLMHGLPGGEELAVLRDIEERDGIDQYRSGHVMEREDIIRQVMALIAVTSGGKGIQSQSQVPYIRGKGLFEKDIENLKNW